MIRDPSAEGREGYGNTDCAHGNMSANPLGLILVRTSKPSGLLPAVPNTPDIGRLTLSDSQRFFGA
jgi:hypothetical protein